MTSKPCFRCGRHWAFNSGPAHFDVITRFCPDCVAAAFPVAAPMKKVAG